MEVRGQLHHRERNLGYPLHSTWVDPTVSVEAEDSDQSLPLRAIEPRLPLPSKQWPNHCVGWANPGPPVWEVVIRCQNCVVTQGATLHVLRNACQFLFKWNGSNWEDLTTMALVHTHTYSSLTHSLTVPALRFAHQTSFSSSRPGLSL